MTFTRLLNSVSFLICKEIFCNDDGLLLLTDLCKINVCINPLSNIQPVAVVCLFAPFLSSCHEKATVALYFG